MAFRRSRGRGRFRGRRAGFARPFRTRSRRRPMRGRRVFVIGQRM